MTLKQSIPAATVLRRPSYLFLFLSIATLFFLFNLVAQNLRLLATGIINYSWKTYITLLTSIVKGSFQLLPMHSRVLLFVMSVLFGMVIALLAFKIRAAKKQALTGTKTATLGAIMGLAVPACASCGIGLLSVIGLGSALWYLPFQGMEIAALSILLLGFALYRLNNSLKECTSCRIDLKIKK